MSSTPWLRRAGIIPALTLALDASTLSVLRRRMPLAAADVVAALTGSAVEFVLAESVAAGGDPHIRHTRHPRVAVAMALAGVTADVTTLLAAEHLLRRRHPVMAKSLSMGAAWTARFAMQRALLGHELRQQARLAFPKTEPPGTLRLSVIVPAFCEADRIGATVKSLRDELADHFGTDYEIVVVDDGSPDRTSDAAREAGAEQVITLPINRGKGAAVREGMRAAHGRVRVFTDADLAYDPSHIARMVEAVEHGADVAIGNRRHRKSQTSGDQGGLRKFGSVAFNALTRPLLVVGYADTQAGIKAFRADAAERIFRYARLEGFAFDVEVLHLSERYGLAVVEVPVEVRNEARSTVKMVPEAFRVVRDVLRMRRWAGRGLYDESTAELVSV
ncbi:MAG: dolichyl-phosphate beta-glucosyltransferase [Acidimicrobiia bacterium]